MYMLGKYQGFKPELNQKLEKPLFWADRKPELNRKNIGLFRFDIYSVILTPYQLHCFDATYFISSKKRPSLLHNLNCG